MRDHVAAEIADIDRVRAGVVVSPAVQRVVDQVTQLLALGVGNAELQCLEAGLVERERAPSVAPVTSSSMLSPRNSM